MNSWIIHGLFMDSWIIHGLFMDFGAVYKSCEFQKKIGARIIFSPRCVRTPESSGNAFGLNSSFSLDSKPHF